MLRTIVFFVFCQRWHMKRKGFNELTYQVCTEPSLRLDTNLNFLVNLSNRRFGGAD